MVVRGGGGLFLMSEVPLYPDPVSAAERRQREGNNLNHFQDFRTENGSLQGLDVALTDLFIPSSLDSGMPKGLRGDYH